MTQAAFTIDLVNQDTISHTVMVEVLNPDENLIVTLDSAGSVQLAAGAIQTLLVNTDATTVLPGTYDVQIKVTNDDGAIIYSNVRIIVTAQGVGDLPDLTLTSRDISFSQLNSEAGDTVTIFANIHNKGTAVASNVAVQFFNSDTLFGEVILANIGPDTFNIVSVPVTLTVEGVYFMRVVVDPLNALVELDESNNDASQLIQAGSYADVTGNIAVVNFNLTQQSPPVAENQGIITDEDISVVAINLTASDPDGDPLTYTLVSQPSHGVLMGTTPNLTYNPNQDYNGGDSFTFKANDGQGRTNAASAWMCRSGHV